MSQATAASSRPSEEIDFLSHSCQTDSAEHVALEQPMVGVCHFSEYGVSQQQTIRIKGD